MQKPTTPEITFIYDWKKKYPDSTVDLSFVKQPDIEAAKEMLDEVLKENKVAWAFSEDATRRILWKFFVQQLDSILETLVDDMRIEINGGRFALPPADINLVEEARWNEADELYDRASGN